jgi:hypothetical protein
MDPQVTAAIIEAVGTVVGGVAVGLIAWLGIGREIRQRHQADRKLELFSAALRDCAELIQKSNEITLDLAYAAHHLREETDDDGGEAGRALDKAVAAMESIGRWGTLVPPDLVPQRSKVERNLRALMNAFNPNNAKDAAVVSATNEAARNAERAIKQFRRDFELWKAKHWND